MIGPAREVLGSAPLEENEFLGEFQRSAAGATLARNKRP